MTCIFSISIMKQKHEYDWHSQKSQAAIFYYIQTALKSIIMCPHTNDLNRTLIDNIIDFYSI